MYSDRYANARSAAIETNRKICNVPADFRDYKRGIDEYWKYGRE